MCIYIVHTHTCTLYRYMYMYMYMYNFCALFSSNMLTHKTGWFSSVMIIIPHINVHTPDRGCLRPSSQPIWPV